MTHDKGGWQQWVINGPSATRRLPPMRVNPSICVGYRLIAAAASISALNRHRLIGSALPLVPHHLSAGADTIKGIRSILYSIRLEMQGILCFCKQIMLIEKRRMYPSLLHCSVNQCLIFSARTKIKEIIMPFLLNRPTTIDFFTK